MSETLSVQKSGPEKFEEILAKAKRLASFFEGECLVDALCLKIKFRCLQKHNFKKTLNQIKDIPLLEESETTASSNGDEQQSHESGTWCDKCENIHMKWHQVSLQ